MLNHTLHSTFLLMGLGTLALLCGCLSGAEARAEQAGRVAKETHTGQSRQIVYPAAMRVVDLTQPPYNADPTGQTDSTAGIQKALDDYHLTDNWILYLPDGTYALSDQLDWHDGARLGPILQGQSRDGVILKLKDGAEGFQDPAKAKPFIVIANRGSADAFCMALRNLTIDTGKGNPGAIGTRFMTNNQGGLREVTIVSQDGQGVIGLDMAFTDMIGPLLIKNVEVRGFDIGVATGRQINSMTFEHLRLIGQNKVGFRNTGQCVSIRGLESRNRVTAVENRHDTGLMVLIDSKLVGEGQASERPAIINTAELYARNVETSGYAKPLETTKGDTSQLRDGRIEEFVAGKVLSLFPSKPGSLGLPIEETPEVAWGDLSAWANIEDFGADSTDNRDDTEAIQRAIDSGAETVYFPHPLPAGKEKTPLPRGSWKIEGTVHLRGNVRRLIGGGGYWTMLKVGGKGRDGAFIIEDGNAPVVVIEDFNIVDGVARDEQCPMIRHRSTRTLVVRHVNSIMSNSLYRGDVGAGKAFFEDVATQFPMNGKDRSGGEPHYFFAKGQQIWARQLDPEKNVTKIVNDGAVFWVLGLKSEVKSTVVETRNGGRTEILGGLNYPSLPGQGPQEMFRIIDSAMTAVIGEAGYNRRFDTLVQETRNGETRTLKQGEAPARSGGGMLPLFTANPLEPLPSPKAQE